MGVAFIAGKYPMMRLRQLVVRPVRRRRSRTSTGAPSCSPATSCTPGSSGNLWVVPEKSKAKSLAYDFIDITMTPEIQNLLGNNGGVPVAADPSAITDPKNKELIDELQHAQRAATAWRSTRTGRCPATTTCWSPASRS